MMGILTHFRCGVVLRREPGLTASHRFPQASHAQVARRRSPPARSRRVERTARRACCRRCAPRTTDEDRTSVAVRRTGRLRQRPGRDRPPPPNPTPCRAMRSPYRHLRTESASPRAAPPYRPAVSENDPPPSTPAPKGSRRSPAAARPQTDVPRKSRAATGRQRESAHFSSPQNRCIGPVRPIPLSSLSRIPKILRLRVPPQTQERKRTGRPPCRSSGTPHSVAGAEWVPLPQRPQAFTNVCLNTRPSASRTVTV